MEKILNKIRNLLDLSHSDNEHEAMAAALKAQELMAKYNVEIEQLDHQAESREIVKEVYYQSGKHEMKKWKFGLAAIISKNFRCKYYTMDKSDIVFYGYKEDAKIALQVFSYLYEAGNKFAVRKYNEVKKSGGYTKGVMNTYLAGFKAGVKSAFEKQCTALMIVTPKEVTDSYEVMSKDFKSFSCNVSIRHNSKLYDEGKADGKAMAEARSISA